MMGVEIRVKGKVQGVGFRPFVWQIAHQLEVKGEVLNDGQGVVIRLENARQLDEFVNLLQSKLPPLAEIESLNSYNYSWASIPDTFSIVQSQSTSVDTQIVPDAATCPECIEELYLPENSRYHYPFTNCTHCGPRFTIISALPYDRPKTVMKDFPLCSQCNAEYGDPADRRYHAQPVACPECGPKVWLSDRHGEKISGNWLEILIAALTEGRIVAIKSVGGFHLACDASNSDAVNRLRVRKHRQSKPFAVMATNIDTVLDIAECSAFQREMLQSRIAPITLLNKRPSKLLASNIAPDLIEVGVMLPSNPVQHLISSYFSKPVVMTSGNGSGLPPALTNEQAIRDLGEIADIFVFHNREILHRCDDSLVRVNDEGEQETLRRSRGLVPDAINLPEGFPSADGYLAYGGDLKSAFAVGKGKQIIVSQYLGDLANIESQQQYNQTITHFKSVYQLSFKHHIADMHPGYYSHQLAEKASSSVQYVQHHHAHIASCLVENSWPNSDDNVLALALDGLGFGDDGEFWGGELFVANYNHYQVIGGIPSVSLVGGDTAAKQPWRAFYCHLKAFLPTLPSTQLDSLFAGKPYQLLDTAIEKKINTHITRSTGRLFDAVAASLGIAIDNMEYEGQAACQLEALASLSHHTQSKNSQSHNKIDCPIEIECTNLTLDLQSFWKQWLALEGSRCDKALWFHIALSTGLARIVKHASQIHNIDHLVLTGGVFHNKLLTSLLKNELGSSMTILQHQKYSCGDGGIALGQLAIALCKNRQTN